MKIKGSKKLQKNLICMFLLLAMAVWGQVPQMNVYAKEASETAGETIEETEAPQESETTAEMEVPQESETTAETEVPQESETTPETEVPQESETTPETEAPQESETTPETEAPAVKFVLKKCTSVSQSRVELVLQCEDDDYSYDIFRASAKDGEYRLIDTVHSYGTIWWDEEKGEQQGHGEKKKVLCTKRPKEMHFWDTTVKFNRRYYYKIRVRDYHSEDGEWTNTMSVLSVLSPVEIKRGYALSAKKIKLDWTRAEGANGYEIYRNTAGKWKKIKTIKNKKTLSFTDTDVKKGKTYRYKIRAYRTYNGKTYYGKYGASYKVKMKDQKIKGRYKKGSIYGKSLSRKKLKEVRRAVQSFKLNHIKHGMSTYEKLLTAYQFLRTTCDYQWRGWDFKGGNTAWDALVYGEAQCAGYAKAYKALCDSMGIPCRFVRASKASVNPNHNWNQVKLGKNWYIVDPQAGFFLLSTKTFKKTGMRWNEKAYPECKYDYKK